MNPLHAIRDMRAIGQLLSEAERVARRMGEEQPAAEHLLIAASNLPDGSAARALAAVELDAERIERAVTDVHAEGLVSAGVAPAGAAHRAEARPLDGPPPTGPYRSSASAQELFQAAAALARGARQRFRGAHVVLASARIEEGTLARALERLGVDRAALADAASGQLG